MTLQMFVIKRMNISLYLQKRRFIVSQKGKKSKIIIESYNNQYIDLHFIIFTCNMEIKVLFI